MGEQQLKILRFLLDRKNAPTLRELQEGLGTASRSHVQRSIKRLESEGLIESRRPGAHKSLRISTRGELVVRLNNT